MTVVYKTHESFRAKHAGPRWLTDGEGGLVGKALSRMRDALLQRVFLGLLARLPQNGPNGETAPPDALVRQGRDRLIYRGIFETDAEYAVRLKAFRDEHATRGNPFTLMRQLHAYVGTTHGVSFRTVDVRGNFYSRSAAGVETSSLDTQLWDWDGDTSTTGDTTRWSRFWVIIYPGTLWTIATATWGTGTWGDPDHVWGFADMTPEHAETLRAIVDRWKPEGTRCINIIVAFDPASFDPAAPEPDGLWGLPYKYVGGAAVASRLATARYLAGR